jgi:type IV pilus assembly protein PilW
MIRRASTLTTAPGSLVASQDYIQSNFEDIILAKGVAANFTLKEIDGVTLAPIREYHQDLYYVDINNNFKRRRLINGSNTTEPLIEGVDDFQLQYGIDTNDDNIPDSFNTTPVFNDYSSWQNVKTVTVFLLISSEYSSLSDDKTYNYAGQTKGPLNDSKKRRLFSFSVSVGNQY